MRAASRWGPWVSHLPPGTNRLGMLISQRCRDEECKQNHTRFLVASYQNQTLLSPMLYAIDQSRPCGETQSQTAKRFILLHLREEIQKHIVKGVDGGRGEEQGLLLPFIPSTTLPVSFSWDFWNSEIPSLTFLLTVGILIQVSGYIFHDFFFICWKGTYLMLWTRFISSPLLCS